MREVESQQLVQKATDQFFEFMETRFKPDIAVRLSADSVEKYRDDIAATISRIRKKPKSYKQEVEKKLRQLVPQLTEASQSFLWHILDVIEERMQNAAEIMLPALRKALYGFTKRADIIIRQLSYLQYQETDDLMKSLNKLADLPDEQFYPVLEKIADKMATFNLKLIDPEHIKLQPRRVKSNLLTVLPDWNESNESEQQWLNTQNLMDQAFGLNHQVMRSYLEKHLRSNQTLNTQDLPIESAQDLMAMSHLIELASYSSAEVISVNPTGKMIENHPYFKKMDEFIIQTSNS